MDTSETHFMDSCGNPSITLNIDAHLFRRKEEGDRKRRGNRASAVFESAFGGVLLE
jgi:hypothetical protein